MAARRLGAVAAHVAPSDRAPIAAPASAATASGGIVDLDFFEEHGWVVVPSVVSGEAVQQAVDEIAALLQMGDVSQPSEWYKSGGEYGKAPLEAGPGMVELYQSQGLWDNRTAPMVHQAFAEVLGTEELLVTMDRCNFKPPARSDDDAWNNGLPLHWDGPRPGEAGSFVQELSVQGALLLSDVGEGSGGAFAP
jgi:hypothetical protein